MAARPGTVDLSTSPSWYPLNVAPRGVSLLRLSERDYAAASFLDERLLERHAATVSLPLEALAAASANLRARAYYLFHLGHVGSTLISRLIGAHPTLFCLREPALLRAQTRPSPPAGGEPLSLRTLLALFSRTWRSEQRAVIKATSTVNEIAGRIFAASEAPKALLICASPLAYLQGILGGPNSRIEARVLGPDRLRRLALQFPQTDWSVAPRTEGEWIASSWLCEMGALEDLRDSIPQTPGGSSSTRFSASPPPGSRRCSLRSG